MYDIDIKNVKKGKKLYYIFLVFGIVFFLILGAVLISNYNRLNSLDSTTTSTNVVIKSHIDDNGTTMYSPVYYYQVDGIEYSCSSNSSSSINPGTSNKTVYYNSNNPSNCMTEYSKSSNSFLLIFLLIPIVFMIIGIINISKINKRVRTIRQLNKHGKLVKNLPYHLENTGITMNNAQVQRLVVNYVLPSGSTIKLYSEPRYDQRISDRDGMVDLIIDENNPNNYFIDFEINRLTGNLPQDFFSKTQTQIQKPHQSQYPETHNINQ